MKKKIFAIFLSIAMVMCMMPSMAWAAEDDVVVVDSPVALKNAMSEKTNTGKTIQLECNIELTSAEQRVVITGEYTLDLNGKEITQVYYKTDGTEFEKIQGTPSPLQVKDGGKLTIIDSSEAKNGKIIGKQAAMTVLGNGTTVTLQQGELSGLLYGIAGNGSTQYHGTVININGGKVTAIGASDGIGGTAIYHPQVGNLNITGGEITGKVGVQVCGGTLNISGGSICATGTDDRKDKIGDGAIGDGAAVSVINRYGNIPNVTINGGTFDSEEQDAVVTYGWDNSKTEPGEGQISWETASDTVSVESGTFFAPFNIELVHEDKVVVKLTSDAVGSVYTIGTVDNVNDFIEANKAELITVEIKKATESTVITVPEGVEVKNSTEISVEVNTPAGTVTVEKDQSITALAPDWVTGNGYGSIEENVLKGDVDTKHSGPYTKKLVELNEEATDGFAMTATLDFSKIKKSEDFCWSFGLTEKELGDYLDEAYVKVVGIEDGKAAIVQAGGNSRYDKNSDLSNYIISEDNTFNLTATFTNTTSEEDNATPECIHINFYVNGELARSWDSDKTCNEVEGPRYAWNYRNTVSDGVTVKENPSSAPLVVSYVPAKEATCTEEGNNEYFYCENINKYFSDKALTQPLTEEDVIIPAGHILVHHEAKEATCTVNGNTEYWYCSVCDKYFRDEECTSVITLADTVVKATGHTYGTDGKCTVCGATKPVTPPSGGGVVTPSADKVVKDKIDAIGVVALDDKAAIEAARAAYDKLTDAQKAKVDNYDKLVAAEKRIVELEEIAKIKGMKLAARSLATKAPSGKKSIRIQWYESKDGTLTKLDKDAFDKVEIYRSTKKGEFGDKPIYTSKSDRYYNTSIKKGKRYYYMVVGVKTVGDEEVRTEMSLMAIRTAK